MIAVACDLVVDGRFDDHLEVRRDRIEVAIHATCERLHAATVPARVPVFQRFIARRDGRQVPWHRG